MIYEAFGPSRLLWGTGYPGTHRSLPLEQELAIITQHIPFLLEDDKAWILGRTAMTIWSFAPMAGIADSGTLVARAFQPA